MRERASVGKEGGVEGKGEADPPPRREPDVGIDPRTLRSWAQSQDPAEGICLTN